MPNLVESSKTGKPMADRIMRLREVKLHTGLSTTGVYERMGKGKFPRSIPLGGRLVGWSAAEIAEWVEQRKAERDTPQAA
jgi:prophage regulatory protein